MNNHEIAEQLRQFADMLEIKGESVFRVVAYRRGAETIDHLPEAAAVLVAEDRLTDVPGIGPGLAGAVRELVDTGRYSAMEEVLGEVPSTLLTLLGIPGVGPKSVGRFYRELGITSLSQLESAARVGQLRALKGFGAKHEARILEGIAFLNRRTNRLSIGTALPVAERIADALHETLGTRVEIVGSTRRRCETVGNLDLLAAVVATDALADAVRRAPFVSDVEQTDDACVVAALQIGATLRVVGADPGRFGTELIRWTGSRDHVGQLAALAGGALASAPSEQAVYASVGLPWIPPELREARGELEAAGHGTLPPLVSVSDLKGDLHLHSQWSDGRATVLELAEAARSRGYQYLSVSDHSGGLRIARGLDVERLHQQRGEIDRVNAIVPEVRLLRSAEVEVHRDGRLDFPDEVLAELDIVVASMHSGLRQASREELTARLVGLLRNPHVDIVAHPTGRIIERRPGADYDWDEVFHVARETGTAIEINGDPARLDMDETHARAAVDAGVMISIDSDAHELASLELVRYGVGIARRGWVGPQSVVNTRPLPDLLAWLGR